MQEHLLEHFKSEGHSGFLRNVSITLIDKTDGKDAKRRGNYWMSTLKTYALFGLNIEECLTNPMQKYKYYWWAYLFVLFFCFFLAYWLDQERI